MKHRLKTLLEIGIVSWIVWLIAGWIFGRTAGMLLAIATASLSIVKEMVIGHHRVEYTDDDILAALNLFEWRDITRIREEMRLSKELGNSFFDMHKWPSRGMLTIRLEAFRRAALVEDRTGYAPKREYRLTQDGQRRKDEFIERELEARRRAGRALPQSQ